MTVYLICFDSPYRHARHFFGFSKGSVEARLEEHRAGRGARLLQVINDAGIGWRLVRTWKGDRKLERRLKKQKHGPRLCPVCNESLAKRQPPEMDGAPAPPARGSLSLPARIEELQCPALQCRRCKRNYP